MKATVQLFLTVFLKENCIFKNCIMNSIFGIKTSQRFFKLLFRYQVSMTFFLFMQVTLRYFSKNLFLNKIRIKIMLSSFFQDTCTTTQLLLYFLRFQISMNMLDFSVSPYERYPQISPRSYFVMADIFR